MLRNIILAALVLLSVLHVKAQEVQGTVADRTSQVRLENVEIVNENTKQKTTTNSKGVFRIKALPNHILVFHQPGYLPDTLFLVDLKPVKRYLTLNNTLLNTVEIKAGEFNPEVEYADVYRKAKAVSIATNRPFIFYPSKYFSKEGKFARRFKRKLEREKDERKIDRRFNEAAVKVLTPLKGAELDYFMVLYRPSVKALDKMDEEDMKFYLMNSYKKFKALPAEKRVSPLLH
jgi:hypothetical protein